MGAHCDNISRLGPCAIIASLSLGAGRDFKLKHRTNGAEARIMLNHGDVLIMWPPCQEEWVHEVPAMPMQSVADHNGRSDRVNWTFRMEREEWFSRTPDCDCPAGPDGEKRKAWLKPLTTRWFARGSLQHGSHEDRGIWSFHFWR